MQNLSSRDSRCLSGSAAAVFGKGKVPAPAGGKARRDDSASAAASLTRLPPLQMARVSTLSGRRARTAFDYHDVAGELFHDESPPIVCTMIGTRGVHIVPSLPSFVKL